MLIYKKMLKRKRFEDRFACIHPEIEEYKIPFEINHSIKSNRP